MFPIPEICEYLTTDTKIKILNTAERDDQGSKVADFFDKAEEMFNEMKWQKKLRSMWTLKFNRKSNLKVFIYLTFRSATSLLD